MKGLESVAWEGLREEELEEALLRLEERVRRVLVRALGHTASNIDILVKLEHDGGRPRRIVVEVGASKRGARDLDALIEAVIEEAVKRFEEELGLRGVRGRGPGGGGVGGLQSRGHNP